MSSRTTGTSSLMQMYCCFSRDPQPLCSRLKEIARLASVAEKSFTGIDTSPNEIVNDAIDRAAMSCLPGCSGLEARQRAFQALLAAQGVAPSIARLSQALRRVGNPEIQRVRACELLPRQGHRYRAPWLASRRVGDVQRLAADIHIVIHEDFTGALGHAPIQGDVLGVQAHQV